MNGIASLLEARSRAEAAGQELLALATGAAFTFALFFGMAHFENVGTSETAAPIEDAPLISAPFEPPPPPPKPVEQTAIPDTTLPFAGLEVSPSESPVAIAVVPPDLAALIPATTNPPRAMIRVGGLQAEFKPKMDIEFDARHVFQETEVDQVPRAIVRTAPAISSNVRQNAETLRAVLLLQIDQKGRVESARVVKTSGNPEFDKIIAQTVREEWLFSPAIRRSKNVRCLAQQAFRVNFTSGSPFEAR